MTPRARGSSSAANDHEDDADSAAGAQTVRQPQRLDKWLWYTRVVKSRTLAAGLIESGRVRLNRNRIDKPSITVVPGDVITVSVNRVVRVLKVLAPGTRRGPAPEARSLYEELTPQPIAPNSRTGEPSGPSTASVTEPQPARREPGSGRPTKRERRQIGRLKAPDF